MTEEQMDREEQQINKNDSKHMTITKFAWDEKVDQVKTLKQQNKQLIEALNWYADNEKYVVHHYEPHIKQRPILLDLGARAQETLQQIQGNK